MTPSNDPTDLVRSQQRSLRAAVPAGAAIADANLTIDREAYERIIKRRDEVGDKLRFGVITLNAGSLLALLSALGGDGNAAQWLGFTKDNAALSAAAFVAGLVLSSVAIIIQQNTATREAGDAYARYSRAGLIVALNEAIDTPLNRNKSDELRQDYAELPLVGFQHSYSSIACQNAAQGLWLFGIALPLSRVLGFGS